MGKWDGGEKQGINTPWIPIRSGPRLRSTLLKSAADGLCASDPTWFCTHRICVEIIATVDVFLVHTACLRLAHLSRQRLARDVDTRENNDDPAH